MGAYLQEAALPNEVVRYNPADVTKIGELFEDEDHWDYIVNCAAVTDVAYCDRDPKRAYAVNARGAANAALFARTRNTHLIHISTDYVFKGDAGPYSYIDRPFPIQVYGHTKYVGERAVASMSGNNPYWIVRLGWLYGRYYPQSPPMLTTYSVPPKLWSDKLGVPTHAGEAASVLMAYMRDWPGQTGISHLAPVMKPISWFDFIAREVPEVEYIDAPPRPRRPEYGGLVSSLSLCEMMSKNLDPLWREIGRPNQKKTEGAGQAER